MNDCWSLARGILAAGALALAPIAVMAQAPDLTGSGRRIAPAAAPADSAGPARSPS